MTNTTPAHKIRLRSDGGDYYASCDCGRWHTTSVGLTRAEAQGQGKDHLSSERS